MKYISKYLDFDLILEGGAAGHIMHPFEDYSMSFREIKSLIDNALSGKISTEEKPTEKMDGISLSVSYRQGKPIYARGKKDIMSYGKNAMDSKGVVSRFSKNKDIAKEIEIAVSSFDTIIQKLPIKYVRNLFKNGSVFATVEIISPSTTNVIPYNKRLMIVHDLVEYDVDGNSLTKSNYDVPKFVSAIEKASESLNLPYTFKEPNTVELVKHKDYEKIKNSYIKIVDNLKGNLSDEDTIGNYMENRFKELILKNFNSYNIDFETDLVDKLSKRLTYLDKKVINLIELRKSNPEAYDWVKKFEDKKLLNTKKKFISPLENLILKLGAEVLKQLSNVITLSDDKSLLNIRNELKNVADKLLSSGNPVHFDKAIEQLSKLDKIGGLNSVLPTEGIVFRHRGKYYKLTGSFAPVNQIMGILRYNR